MPGIRHRMPMAKPGFYRTTYAQSGHGIGSVFARIFRSILPALTRVGKRVAKSNIAKELVKTGKDVATEGVKNVVIEAVKGGDVKGAAKEGLTKARAKIGETLEKNLKKKRDPSPNPQSELPKPKKAKSAKIKKSSAKKKPQHAGAGKTVAAGVISTKRKKKYGDIFD